MHTQPGVYCQDQGRCFFIKVADYEYLSRNENVQLFINKYVPSQKNLIKEGDNPLYKKALFCTEWLNHPDEKRTGHGVKRGSEIFVLSLLYAVVPPMVPGSYEICETVQPMWVFLIGCGIFLTGMFFDIMYNQFLYLTYLQDLKKCTSLELNNDGITNCSL